MNITLVRLSLADEREVVRLRIQAREIAARLGIELRGRVEIASVVSLVACEILRLAGECEVEFRLDGQFSPSLVIRVVARMEGWTGPEPFLVEIEDHVLRMVDSLKVEVDGSDPHVRSVAMARALPSGSPFVPAMELERMAELWSGFEPSSLVDELIRQDRELIEALEECESQARELREFDRRLEEAGRAILALDAELNERAESLQRAGEMKRRFLSKVSHELRTPLASILSLTRLLLDQADGELSVEQERQVSFIDRASGDLTSLVNDLIDLARIDAGRELVQPGEIRVPELFSVLRGMFHPLQPSGSAVTLVFEDAEGLPMLWTDRAKLTQVLHTFLSNALKFTERGEVRIRAKLAEGDSIRFSVIDPGIGIEPDQIERVFEEFGQVDSPLQRRTKGTGLGLPLASKLARLLGGRIDAQSDPGVGSTFTATIPIRLPGEALPSE